jgi:hypothetical protein
MITLLFNDHTDPDCGFDGDPDNDPDDHADFDSSADSNTFVSSF